MDVQTAIVQESGQADFWRERERGAKMRGNGGVSADEVSLIDTVAPEVDGDM